MMTASQALARWLAAHGVDVRGGHALAVGEFDHLPAGRKISAQNATWAVNAVLDRQSLTEPMARALWEVTGIPQQFWLDREA
jgi:hypothetical protein